MKWSYVITWLAAHFMCGLISDLMICKFRKSVVIHDTEWSLRVHTDVIKNTNPTQPNLKSCVLLLVLFFQGELLYFPDLEVPAVVSDIKIFCGLLNDLQDVSKDTSLRNGSRYMNLNADMAILPHVHLVERWQEKYGTNRQVDHSLWLVIMLRKKKRIFPHYWRFRNSTHGALFRK